MLCVRESLEVPLQPQAQAQQQRRRPGKPGIPRIKSPLKIPQEIHPKRKEQLDANVPISGAHNSSSSKENSINSVLWPLGWRYDKCCWEGEGFDFLPSLSYGLSWLSGFCSPSVRRRRQSQITIAETRAAVTFPPPPPPFLSQGDFFAV